MVQGKREYMLWKFNGKELFLKRNCRLMDNKSLKLTLMKEM